MQGAYTHLLVGNTVLDRYLIEEQLGQCGFGAVYKVRDQQYSDKVFALKEVAITTQTERDLFTFESEVLKRLQHPALPRIYYSFANELTSRAYMLMDYIEGPNLEKLRQQRTMKRFSTTEAIALLTPIAQAINYLHIQQPPIVHRDIKPSNIIHPIANSGAMLVDFGIAKTYEQDATTSAMRMCSPGYGAPEQYVGGTNPRTDIYGLAATLYTLITGEVPVEAILRLTHLSSKQRDPLKLINELVPGVPAHVAGAIHQAMALNSEERFASVEQFWQALHAYTPGYASPARVLPSDSPANPWDKTTAFMPPSIQRPTIQATTKTQKFSKRVPVLLGLALLVIIIGVIVSSTLSSLASDKTPTVSTSSATATAATTSTANAYPHLHTYYAGTLSSSESGGYNAELILSKIQQNETSFKGTLNVQSIKKAATIEGTVATDNSIHFTVPGKEALRFQGTVRTDGTLAGTYCHRIDATNCVFMGTWEATPTSPPAGDQKNPQGENN